MEHLEPRLPEVTGIVVGCVLVLALVIGLIYYCKRRSFIAESSRGDLEVQRSIRHARAPSQPRGDKPAAALNQSRVSHAAASGPLHDRRRGFRGALGPRISAPD